MFPDDDVLWWLMVGSALLAAALSLVAIVLDRRVPPLASARTRYLLHMLSYVVMSVSILFFILRGFLGGD